MTIQPHAPYHKGNSSPRPARAPIYAPTQLSAYSIPEIQSIKRNQQAIIRSDCLISPHSPKKISLRLREHTPLIRQRILIDHLVIARRIQDISRSRQFTAQILARRIFRIEKRVRWCIRVDVFRETEGLRRSTAGDSARTNGCGAVASDFQTDVAVGFTAHHVEFDPGGWQEVAALDVANKACGKCDGCGFALGYGEAVVWIGGYRGGSLKDGVGLGARSAVGDVETSASAFVCRGSGIEEGFQ